MKVKPLICIQTTGTRRERRAACEKLCAEIRPQLAAHGLALRVDVDEEGKGSLAPWLRQLTGAYEQGQAGGYTHFVHLPDDAILVPHFVDVLIAAITAQPEAILCFQSNHHQSPEAYANGARWYTTVDGFTGFAGTLPMERLREHIEWRREHLLTDIPIVGDLGVNLWAMATGRLIYKGLPSLVDHDLGMPSAEGNDWHATLSPRRPLVWEGDKDLRGVDWSGPVAHLGRTYKGNHWRLMIDVPPKLIDAALIEAMYTAARGGEPVSDTPMVALSTATYREAHEIIRATSPSRRRVIEDLAAHDIGASLLRVDGDSLPQRMRQRAVHEFLKSTATHLLWWDADVECLDPTTVRTMLESGHDVVCGAYPFKATDGRCVLNMWEADAKRFDDGEPVPEWLEVQHAGTGFMLVSRKCIVDLMARHPELMHVSQSRDADRGAPLWAIYDTAIVDLAYLSEDYFFCHLVHQAGGKVWVYTPARFRHYGLYGYEGSVRGQFAEAAE